MTDYVNDISIPYNLRQNYSNVKDFLDDICAPTIALSV